MMANTLFGHLATRFASSPENLATESLSYILNNSPAARDALLRFLDRSTVQLPRDLAFQTQVSGEDGAIPDLVGLDAQRTNRLIVEAKFWAGLTENQPVTYLRRLPAERTGILLFVAPGMRLPTLSAELVRRCSAASVELEPMRQIGDGLLTARLGPGQALTVASWRAVLACILDALVAEQQMEAASDVRQLLGLCDRMDQDALLPLSSEELTSDVGRRVCQYCQLVDDVTRHLRARKLASTKRLRVTGGMGWYGQYMLVSGFGCCLQFNASYWRDYRPTPLWFTISDVADGAWVHPAIAKRRLSQLECEQPSRLLEVGDKLAVPLFIPTNAESDGIVASLLGQIREIAECLADDAD